MMQSVMTVKFFLVAFFVLVMLFLSHDALSDDDGCQYNKQVPVQLGLSNVPSTVAHTGAIKFTMALGTLASNKDRCAQEITLNFTLNTDGTTTVTPSSISIPSDTEDNTHLWISDIKFSIDGESAVSFDQDKMCEHQTGDVKLLKIDYTQVSYSSTSFVSILNCTGIPLK